MAGHLTEVDLSKFDNKALWRLHDSYKQSRDEANAEAEYCEKRRHQIAVELYSRFTVGQPEMDDK